MIKITIKKKKKKKKIKKKKKKKKILQYNCCIFDYKIKF